MVIWQLKSHQVWMAMIFFGVIFAVAGLAVVVGSFLIGEPFTRWAVFAVGVLVLLVGIIPLAFAPRARREGGKAVAQDLVPTHPRAVAHQSTPWPLADVAAALAQELEGTPYLVEHNEQMIRVTWDLEDRSWWVLAQKNGTDRVFETRLVQAGDAKLSRTDISHQLDWQAGVPVVGSLKASTAAGRVWTYEKRIEWGTDAEGLSRKVDYTFKTRDLNKPLAAVLRRAGWGRPVLDGNAQGAVFVAGIGASAIVLVPLALWLQKLVEG